MVTNNDATTYFLGMKDNIKPFNNLKVRQALNYAVNKTRLVQLLNGPRQCRERPRSPAHGGLQRQSQGLRLRPLEGEEALGGSRLSERLLVHDLGPRTTARVSRSLSQSKATSRPLV